MRRTLGTSGNRARRTSGNRFRGARNSRGAAGPGTSDNGISGSWNSWNSERGEPWESKFQGRGIPGARRSLEPRIMEFQVRRSLAFGRQPDIGSTLFFQGGAAQFLCSVHRQGRGLVDQLERGGNLDQVGCQRCRQPRFWRSRGSIVTSLRRGPPDRGVIAGGFDVEAIGQRGGDRLDDAGGLTSSARSMAFTTTAGGGPGVRPQGPARASLAETSTGGRGPNGGDCGRWARGRWGRGMAAGPRFPGGSKSCQSGYW